MQNAAATEINKSLTISAHREGETVVVNAFLSTQFAF